jgi:hypothetical protein
MQGREEELVRREVVANRWAGFIKWFQPRLFFPQTRGGSTSSSGSRTQEAHKVSVRAAGSQEIPFTFLGVDSKTR